MSKKNEYSIAFLIVIGLGLLIAWVLIFSLSNQSAFAVELEYDHLKSPLSSSNTEPNNIYLPTMVKNSTGKIIKVLVSGASEVDKFEQATISFEQATGLDVVFEGVDDFSDIIGDRVLSGNAPDVAIFPQPGLLNDFVKGGFTIDLNDWFTTSYLQDQYAQSWLDMATMEGEMAGVWYKSNLKSLVWFPKQDFITAGYLIPNTWSELIALSDQMVSDGHTPWCIGIGSGTATGWVGTDWVEDIMLRTTTTENYDKWTNGELKFVSPQVENAFTMMADIWFDEDYVFGGRSSITTTYFGDAILPMFNNPPDCWLHRQAIFIEYFLPAGIDIGDEVDYFYLPPIDPQYDNPVLIAGDIAGVFNDRPEVRVYVKHLTTGESVRYFVELGEVISPHQDANLDWYPSDAKKGYAEIVLDADTIRFDASDLMPGEVGAGEFWSGIVDYVNGADLNTVLSNIDAAWP